MEKKTNIGFYNLKDPLGFELSFKSLNFFHSYLLSSIFKFGKENENFLFESFFIFL
jgi:hypothetical protein